MNQGQISSQYVVKIGESTEEGKRTVQVFERMADTVQDKPLGKPQIIDSDEEAAVAIHHTEHVKLASKEVDVEQVPKEPGRY
jgi:hypothetical protein